MRYGFLLLLFPLLLVGCFEEKTDEYLLQKDREELEKSTHDPKVILYKYFKLSIRTAALRDTSFPELEVLRRVNDLFVKVDSRDSVALDSILQDKLFVPKMFADYWSIRHFVRDVDEDVFPTLGEGMKADSLPPGYVLLAGEEKAYAQNGEHAALAVLALIARDLGTNVALYECFKVKPEVMPEGEPRALFQYVRSSMLMAKGLYYLSEYELTDNIDWLNEHPNVELPWVRHYFWWIKASAGQGGRSFDAYKISDEQNYLIFHAINHLMRGIDRLMMDRKIDEERALEDLEAFMDDADKLGLNTEVVWCVDAYLALKKEDSNRAKRALINLKTSPILSDKERDALDEAIAYLDKREPDKVLNGVYDRYFLSKIITKYIYYQLKEVDWKQVLKDSGVEGIDEKFETIEKVEKAMDEMEKYTEEETIKETGEELKEKSKELQKEGDKLLDKAKKWWDE